MIAASLTPRLTSLTTPAFVNTGFLLPRAALCDRHGGSNPAIKRLTQKKAANGFLNIRFNTRPSILSKSAEPPRRAAE